MTNKKKDYKLAFSMVELIVSISIMTVLGLLLTMSITKKTQKLVSSAIGGEFVCYKDVNNKLHQKTTLRFLGGKVQEEDKEASVCKFDFPESARDTTIYLVGGGGGGGGLPNEVFHTNGDSDNIQRICKVYNEKGREVPQRVIQDDSADTQIIPYSCENVPHYHKSHLPSCVRNGNEGAVTGFYIYNGQLKYACDESCVCENNNLNNAGAAEFDEDNLSTIVNGLSSYMDNESYKTVVLDDFVLRIQDGDGTEKNIIPDVSVGDNFACFNGVGQTTINGGDTTISATKGIVNVNKSVMTTDAFGEINIEPFNLFYSVKLLEGGTCRLPVGKAGKAGATQTISSQNLAGRKLTISADKIGDGGKGGDYQADIQNINPQNIYTSGSRGGDTVFELGTVTRKASGGAGGVIDWQTVNLKANVIQQRKFYKEDRAWALNVNNRYMWADDFHYASSELSSSESMAPISAYVRDNVLTAVVDQDALSAQPSRCENGFCSDVKLPTDKASYGAAGGATVSMLKYDPIYAMLLYKVDRYGRTPVVGRKWDNNNVYFIYKWPELIKPQNQTNNGSGGAIIFKWGD